LIRVNDCFRRSQQRLENFNEQLSVCHHDFIEQQTSLRKLNEFHVVLKQQMMNNEQQLDNARRQQNLLYHQYQCSKQTLCQLQDQMQTYRRQRSILARMLVRRMSSCQLLYASMTRFDEHSRQRAQQIDNLCKVIRSLIVDIRYRYERNQRTIERQQQWQCEVYTRMFTYDRVQSMNTFLFPT
jgi:hypothetical protein